MRNPTAEHQALLSHRCTDCNFCRGIHALFSYKNLTRRDHPRVHTAAWPGLSTLHWSLCCYAYAEAA